LPLLENNCLDPSAAAASTTLLHLTTACLQTAEQAVLGTNVQTNNLCGIAQFISTRIASSQLKSNVLSHPEF